MVHAYASSTQEEAGRPDAQGHPWFYSELKASLCSRKPCFKTVTTKTMLSRGGIEGCVYGPDAGNARPEILLETCRIYILCFSLCCFLPFLIGSDTVSSMGMFFKTDEAICSWAFLSPCQNSSHHFPGEWCWTVMRLRLILLPKLGLVGVDG